MAASKWTADHREAFINLTRSGLGIADAARETGVREKTAKGWLARGRQETSGEYRDFTDAVEAARLERDQAEQPMDPDELKLVVSRAAKKGSVRAMKLRWEMIRAEQQPGSEPADPFAALDSFDVDTLKE